MRGEVTTTAAVTQAALLPSKSALPQAAAAAAEQSPSAAAETPAFDTVDLLAANREDGLPGLYALLKDAKQRDPSLLNRAMQELLARLGQYLLRPRHLVDAERVKQHMLNSGLFLDAELARGLPSTALQNDLKGLLNNALQQLLPHRILTERSGGTAFEYEPEVAVQILHKNLQEGQKAIIGKLLQTSPWLNEYQQNVETPVANRHIATWLGHAVEAALCHIVQQQLRSFSDENQRHWRINLYIEQDDGLLTVPVDIQQATTEEEAPWVMGFTVKLRSGNSVKVSIILTGTDVEVHFEADDFLTHQRLSRRRDKLHSAFRSRGLQLEDMTSKPPGKRYG